MRQMFTKSEKNTSQILWNSNRLVSLLVNLLLLSRFSLGYSVSYEPDFALVGVMVCWSWIETAGLMGTKLFVGA